METDIQGCSTCQQGEESYETFIYTVSGKEKKAIQYDFRSEDGELYSTVNKTVELCRRSRDAYFNLKTS